MIRRFPKDRPWHMVVNFAGPHDPEDITQRMEKTVRGRKFPQPFNSTQLDPEQHEAIRQNYTAMVENIDRWLGIYLDELKQRGDLKIQSLYFQVIMEKCSVIITDGVKTSLMMHLLVFH
ncbi:hypothetical protein GQR86_03910 [Providencia vermicola]|nr:hypothetical protein [Providencia vermicola]